MPRCRIAMIVGTNIGRYRIVRKIGAGGMGMVFLGEHILLGRQAAIKVLRPALAVHAELVERFFNEARATSRIHDAGVVQVFDFGYHVDGTAFIVMELLEGESVADRIDRHGRLSALDALRIARQTAGGLAAAHACEIVHRDLKPENIFVVDDPDAPGGERAKLIDFGICRLVHDASLTESGAMVGTPLYMSPEQCRGETVDGRSDVYGLGCVLFQMLTGRTPFEQRATGELIVAHLQQAPPTPSALVPELPAAIDALVARCLEKSPEARFSAMSELQVAIDETTRQLPVTTPAPRAERSTVALGPGFGSDFDAERSTIRTMCGPGQARRSMWTAADEPRRHPMRTIVIAAAIVALAAVAFATLRDPAPPALPAVPRAAFAPEPPVLDPVAVRGAAHDTTPGAPVRAMPAAATPIAIATPAHDTMSRAAPIARARATRAHRATSERAIPVHDTSSVAPLEPPAATEPRRPPERREDLYEAR